MWYVEFLRARKALTIYGIVLVAAFLFAATFRVFSTSIHTVGRLEIVPIEMLSSVAALITAIFATFLATSLAHDVAGHLEVAWTKPVSRYRLIFETFAVDAIVIGIGYVGTIVTILGIISLYGHAGTIGYAPAGFGRTLILLVSVFAFYAVLQAVTAGNRRFAGTIAGISWPVLLFVANAPAMGMPTPVTRAIELLNYLNPMMLLAPHGTTGGTRGGAEYQLWRTGSEIDAFLLLALGTLVCILRWRRLEI